MEFRASHGCYDVEREVGGNFTVDAALEVEDGGGAEADDVGRTVNYVAVYETVREQMAIPSRIIEHAALRCIDAVMARFPEVLHAELTVAKLAPPMGGKADRVAVTLKR